MLAGCSLPTAGLNNTLNIYSKSIQQSSLYANFKKTAMVLKIMILALLIIHTYMYTINVLNNSINIKLISIRMKID